MPSRGWKLRIQDILDAITEIKERVKDMTFEEFTADPTLVKSVLYDFIIIGEASKNIPAEIQAQYSHIPWRLMTGMRNIVAHEYFQVNLKRIWATITYDLENLEPQLEEILRDQRNI